MLLFSVIQVRDISLLPCLIKKEEFRMKKIASFQVDHDKLTKGMYVSRIDGDCITYDIRMKVPNGGDYLSASEAHTIEHLFATYARNSEYRI